MGWGWGAAQAGLAAKPRRRLGVFGVSRVPFGYGSKLGDPTNLGASHVVFLRTT